MKYDALSRNTVKITLSEEDMLEYSLCTESISEKTPQSKAELVRFLKKMKLFEEYSPERLFLEAFPKNDGGCVLYVSNLSEVIEEELPSSCENGCVPLICNVKSLDVLIKLCTGIRKLFPEMPSSAFSRDKSYVLVIEAPTKQAGRILHFLSEYGKASADKSEYSSLWEYGDIICAERAVEKIALLA